MKKLFILVITILLFPFCVQAASPAYDVNKRVAGHILLQVEKNGEAWHVHPDTLLKYYMADGQAAYEMMRYFGLGVNNANIEKLLAGDKALAIKLIGKIVLQVEKNGEAYYIKPQDLSVHYLKNGEEAYKLMRFHSLGITNDNLDKIPEGKLVRREEVLLPDSLTTYNKSEAQRLYYKGFNVWVATKDYVTCEVYYKQALQNYPDFGPALSSQGHMYGAFHNDYEKGEKFLMRAMQMDPTWGYAPFNLGLLYDLWGMHLYLDLDQISRDEWWNTYHKKGEQFVQFAIDKFPTHPDNGYFRQTLKVMKEAY
jgi:tetratricopeptide (TPR) repeat protein